MFFYFRTLWFDKKNANVAHCTQPLKNEKLMKKMEENDAKENRKKKPPVNQTLGSRILNVWEVLNVA